MKYILRAKPARGLPDREARCSYKFFEEVQAVAMTLARTWKRPVEIWRDRSDSTFPVDTVEVPEIGP